MRLSAHHRSPIGKPRAEWDQTTNSQSLQPPMHIPLHRRYIREEYQVLRRCRQLVPGQYGWPYSTSAGSFPSFEADLKIRPIEFSAPTIATPGSPTNALRRNLLVDPKVLLDF